jgi:RES domain-containing protein
MRVWRIARQGYAPLDGEGARRFGGRWNSRGLPAVYTAGHLSLAVLEVLVHTDPDLIPLDLAIFEIEMADALSIQRIHAADLPEGWAATPDHRACRELGDAWLAQATHPVLEVPSAVVPEEANYLINPTHADSAIVKVVRTRPFVFDARLI